MPRSVAAAAARLRLLALRIPAGWRSALVRLALVWALLVAVFWREWTAMADQWWNVSTYNHILLIPAIVAWLVYERLHLLLQLDPRAWSPGPAAAAGAAFLWMLGDFSGLDTARQLGAVLVLVAATLTLLGPRVAAGLAFPLGYMLLLVPFGDELVAPLQMITAAITIGLVRLSGVPAAVDGVFINTPVGLFEVAEACSGVKFLIAMIAFGILVAGLGFRSWWRRAAFMLVCLIVPVLANGMRAWATVFAAQSVGAETAAGFDHIVYGWIFFALVIAFVLAISWRFFDRSASDPAFDVEWIKASPLIGRLARLTMPANAALAALGAVVLVAQLWGDAANRLAAPLPARIDLPAVPGWRRVDYAPTVPWEPRADGAGHRLLGSYADGTGNSVEVFLAVYSGQGEGREAGGFGQGALPSDKQWDWLSPGASFADGRSDRLLAHGKVGRLAATWYRTGDLLTGSNARLKLANMRDRLLLRARPTAMLIVSAEERRGKPARPAVEAFVRAVGPLGSWMDRTAQVR